MRVPVSAGFGSRLAFFPWTVKAMLSPAIWNCPMRRQHGVGQQVDRAVLLLRDLHQVDRLDGAGPRRQHDRRGEGRGDDQEGRDLVVLVDLGRRGELVVDHEHVLAARLEPPQDGIGGDGLGARGRRRQQAQRGEEERQGRRGPQILSVRMSRTSRDGSDGLGDHLPGPADWRSGGERGQPREGAGHPPVLRREGAGEAAVERVAAARAAPRGSGTAAPISRRRPSAPASVAEVSTQSAGLPWAAGLARQGVQRVDRLEERRGRRAGSSPPGSPPARARGPASRGRPSAPRRRRRSRRSRRRDGAGSPGRRAAAPAPSRRRGPPPGWRPPPPPCAPAGSAAAGARAPRRRAGAAGGRARDPARRPAPGCAAPGCRSSRTTRRRRAARATRGTTRGR